MKNVMIVILLALSLVGCSRVEPGHVGIVVNQLGASKGVNAEEVGVGYVWLGFFKDLYTFPTYKVNYVWTASPHEGRNIDESISFQSNKGLSINADFGISLAVDPAKAAHLFQTYRKDLQEITDIFIRNYVRDAVNELASKMEAEDIYGTGKTKLLSDVTRMVQAKVKDDGILIDQVYLIGTFRFPETFVAALNLKLEAQQRASQRENEVKEAEAQARKDVARATGEANARLTVATAEAQANTKLSSSLTPQLVEYLKMQKWNGQLPTVMGAANSMLMLDIGRKSSGSKE